MVSNMYKVNCFHYYYSLTYPVGTHKKIILETTVVFANIKYGRRKKNHSEIQYGQTPVKMIIWETSILLTYNGRIKKNREMHQLACFEQ
jgi:hypothetical protein